MEVLDLLSYLKAEKNTLPDDNGVKAHAHKVFSAYANLMNTPNATIYDVYYNIEAFYDALKATYTGYTLRNYILALAESLNLNVVKELFTEDQIVDFKAHLEPIINDARECYNKFRKDKHKATNDGASTQQANAPLVAHNIGSDDDVESNHEEKLDISLFNNNRITTSRTSTPTTSIVEEVSESVRVKQLEVENALLKEKIEKQKKKIEELRQDAKNDRTRLWNVLLASVNQKQ